MIYRSVKRAIKNALNALEHQKKIIMKNRRAWTYERINKIREVKLKREHRYMYERANAQNNQ